VCQSAEWWADTGANIHVCADISLFSSYQCKKDGALLMGNRSHVRVLGVGTVILKFTLGKTMLLKNVHHVLSIKRILLVAHFYIEMAINLCSSLINVYCQSMGHLLEKAMIVEACPALSLHDVCNKSVNNVISYESYIWHSRHCHINFGCVSRLANLNLILNFDLVKGSKCQVCGQSKQHRKPHKATEARNLAPLDLIHSNLCEMNGILTKGGKQYFITFIDDSTRFRYVYLLKSKDEPLHYFKTYKDEVENHLKGKLNS
jgi:hypothetical protein